jgi:hypothetical protein
MTNTMTAPTELNGHPVVKSKVHKTCVTIMAHNKRDLYEEFIVATWWPSLGSSWMWGHYFKDKVAALADFTNTADRNAKRT